MKANKWFRRGNNAGDIKVGKESVRISYVDAVHQSMNDDDNNGSYHISHTGEISSRNKLTNMNSIDHSPNPMDSANSGVEQTSVRVRPGFGLLRPQKDCLDTAFDGIESFACQEKTGEIFPFGDRPPSPTELFRQQKIFNESFGANDISTVEKDTEKNLCISEKKDAGNDSCTFEQASNTSTSGLDNNISTACCSNGTSNDSFGFISRMLGGMLPRRGDDNEMDISNTSASSTLNTTDPDAALGQSEDESRLFPVQSPIHYLKRKKEIDSDPYRIERENSLLDIESAGRARKLGSSQATMEKKNKDRLEELRQSKRSLEEERLRQSQGKTIVIPRSSLYETKEENIEIPKPCTSTTKLRVGGSVTNKVEEKYYFCRRLSLTGIILLIAIGILLLAFAIFWPTRKLLGY